MMTVVILNQKGGVGKTSLCHHLAGTLAKRGRKVLLVDTDPQASLTQGLFGPEWTETRDPAETLAGYFEGRSFADQVVHKVPNSSIDLVPGNWKLADFNVAACRPHAMDSVRIVAELTKVLDTRGEYDWCVIDCPPNLLMMSYAALVAADGLVIPIQAEDYGSQGIRPMIGFLEVVRGEHNPHLVSLGYLITMFDSRPSLPRFYEHSLRETYGEEVFRHLMPRSIDFPEAVAKRMSVACHRPKGKAAHAMAAIADEIDERYQLAFQAQSDAILRRA